MAESGFVFQVRKIVDKGSCGVQKFPIGPLVTIDGNCKATAQCKAAIAKLKEPHHPGGYHDWLVRQSNGVYTEPNVYMPFEWFVTKGSIEH